MNKNGVNYEMGADIKEVGPGDAVKVGPGRLEVITSITPSGSWDKHIVTESGQVLSMLNVLAYGKKEEKK